MMDCVSWQETQSAFLYCTAVLVLPKGHEDGVPFLMDNNVLGQDGLGSSLLLNQVVFAHKHSVGELGAVGQSTQLKPKLKQIEDLE